MTDDYDILIAGGGLVGASLACALANPDSRPSGLRIGVVEAVPYRADNQPSFDERTLALAYGSRRIFEGLGVWADIEALGAAPIERIHVSDRGRAGFTRMDCRDEQLPALGYVVATRVLGQALWQRLSRLDGVDVLCPRRITDLHIDADSARLNLRDEREAETTLSTRLVVAADGGQSSLRRLAGIKTFDSDYGQSAIIANVLSEKPHANQAYERFTESGPLAILPMCDDTNSHGNRSAIVWTVATKDVERMMAMDDEAFIDGLQSRFGQRLGRFIQAGERQSYPLRLQQAREHVRPRLALIGNAAHTLHPIAGQGFNLGLRDVAALSQVLVDALRDGREPGALNVLKEYASWRRRDHLRVIAFTDSMVRTFSNTFGPLVLARNLGLMAADMLPPVKRLLTRQAMGLTGRLPRLARGLKL